MGFAVAQGRGKPAQVDGEELENFRVFREHVLAQLQSFVHGSQSLLMPNGQRNVNSR
jgi:hypothetical protein